ncbi:unnamed protein product [Candida verbasci]|uniref:Uncharacterized protein n=1 Tax=Candida verbasci TaxID=1227364 RepID=A0A9W4XD52_9ASCO|nr:unnamed protein product [Candida verbasci]
MVFNSFIRFAKFSGKFSSKFSNDSHINQQFFQSSYPYLNSRYYLNSLTNLYHLKKTKKYHFKNDTTSNGDKNPFLGISDGHYGVYYSMYNRDSERRRKKQDYNDYIRHYIIKQLEMNDRFGIYKFAQNHKEKRNHQRRRRGNSLHIKFLSLSAKFLISKAVFDALINFDNVKKSLRKIIAAVYYKPNIHLVLNNSSPIHHSPSTSSGIFSQVFSLSNRSFSTTTKINQQVTPEITTEKITNLPQEDNFDHSFIDCQVKNILNAHESENFNLILPLYQTVKRNNLQLPSIELYNIVLKSIIHRSLDSELKIENIENKLTNLLTVYQDILQTTKPNNETFDLVINELLDSSLKCSEIPISNQFELEQINNKAKEFVQISLELFNSIKDLDLTIVFPKLLSALNKYPELLTKEILQSFIPLLDTKVENKDYILSILDLSKCFTQFQLVQHNEIYNLIDKFYKQYTKLSQSTSDEIKVYEKVLVSLMLNNHSAQAGQLLDNILIEYKNSKIYSQEQIGQLIGSFLKSYSFKFGIDNKTFKLLSKFQAVNLEMSISFYNFFICKLIENGMYENAWTLYNRVSITEDFQNISNLEMIKEDSISCRDVLLSLNIVNQNDENVFQLVKEMLFKEHLIAPNVLIQLIEYCSINNYNGLILEILESQTQFYSKPNQLLSLIIDHLSALTSTKLYNSNFFKQSYLTFSLQSDNIYGLYKSFELHKSTINLEFNSVLINEFEDTENHYIELPEQIKIFKQELIQQFKQEIQNAKLSPSMVETCKYLNININITKQPKESNIDMNLNTLLTIDYKVGVQKFFKLFDQGSTFDIQTWDMILNKKLFDKKINMMKLFQRIWMTDCDESRKIEIINRLISFKKDKILAYLIQFFLRYKIFDVSLWNNLLSTANEINISKNHSTLKKILNNVKVLKQINSNLQCKEQYDKFLMRYGNMGNYRINI